MRNGALKNLRERKRKGFTLVELLIVIIIIGILAGAMLMVAGSGTDKAEATKIVSDLRTLKTACLMYYADKNSWPGTTTNAQMTNVLGSYMDRPLGNAKYDYQLILNDPSEYLAVGATNVNEKGVQEKLAQMAKEVGLYAASTVSPDANSEYKSGQAVWFRVK